MSQHIAGGQFDPTAQAVMAQLKALPASPQEVPSLDFFEERVARAARRDVKRFQHHNTWCVFLFVVRCHVCNTFSLLHTALRLGHSIDGSRRVPDAA
jgi:hypothetical protein